MMRYDRLQPASGAGGMRGWLIYLGLGLLTYWLVIGQPDWASIVLWLVVFFWPLVLAWEVGWWLLKVALAVGLSLFLLAVAYDVFHRRRP
jgi:cell division protein FtsW (lipid II flippase)